MGIFTLIRHPGVLASLLLGTFVPWYCLEAPVWLLTNYIAYAKAWMEIISFPYLLRTLVSPWKNIADAYPKNALNIQRILEAFTLNITARVIGLIVRLVAIVVGITIQVALLTGFIAFLLAWIAFPFALPLGIGFAILSLIRGF